MQLGGDAEERTVGVGVLDGLLLLLLSLLLLTPLSLSLSLLMILSLLLQRAHTCAISMPCVGVRECACVCVRTR